MKNNLPILAIETSGAACSVAAIIREDYSIEYSIKLKNVQSEKLTQLIEKVVEETGIKLDKFNHIAVSIGPGSFTGLRIGLSVAKGIAFGANLPIVAVPTFDALAYRISKFLIVGDEFIISNNVNREEVYFAKYKIETNKMINTAPIEVIKRDELEKKIKPNFRRFGDFNLNNQENISSPSATDIGLWSYIFGKDLVNLDFDFLEPLYLKNFIPKVKK